MQSNTLGQLSQLAKHVNLENFNKNRPKVETIAFALLDENLGCKR